MASTTTRLDVSRREPGGSRAARRLRRSGRVPGVLYGGADESIGFDVDARELRVALASSGAVLDLSVDGETASDDPEVGMLAPPGEAVDEPHAVTRIAISRPPTTIPGRDPGSTRD